MTKRPFFRYGSVILLVFAFVQLLWWLFPGICTVWQLQVDDQLMRLAYSWHGRRAASPDIVHIDLDDQSLARLPYSKSDFHLYGDLIRTLHAAGVKSILVDIVFPNCRDTASCSALADPVADAGNVTFPVILSAHAEAVAPMQAAPPLPLQAAWHIDGANQVELIEGQLIMSNFNDLNKAAAGLGHINLDPDRDGVYRRVPMFIRTSAGAVPSLSLQVLSNFLQVPSERIFIDKRKGVILPGAALPGGRSLDIHIPVDRQGRNRINFSGPWNDSFSHYSFATVLENGATPQGLMMLTDELEGTLAIISDVTIGGRDYGPVPLSSYFPLSGLHANLINSVLENDFLREAGSMPNLALNLLLLLCLALAAFLFRGYRLSLAAGALLCSMLAASSYLFLEHRFALEIVKPTVAFTLAFPAVMLVQFLQVQQEKAKLTHYFAPSVVKKLLNEPHLLDVVAKKELTVLFSDIAGFTAWSSTRDAQDIHRTLNRYFDRMADIVFAHQGTIDKYMGDGLMVFFGDPVPVADHATRAVMAARAMQLAARDLRKELEKEGGMPLVIRIGIHTGEVVVGNMGSHSRLDYTVIGSNVNLAQRLESNCPLGGILISEQVYRQLGGHLPTRPAGTIQAKGFNQPIPVHTVDWEEKGENA